MFNNSKGRSATEDWLITGWFGPQKNARGERCVHLYPEMPGGSKWRCATMYEETFQALPDEIRIPCETEKIIPGSAPGGEDAIPLKQPFRIQTWLNNDGTSSKDVAQILGDDVVQAQAGSTPASFGLQQASTPMQFNAMPTEDITFGFGSIVSESFVKMQTLYNNLEDFFGDIGQEGAGEWQRMITSLVWRDANDQWRVVRPSLLAAAESRTNLTGSVILNGERENFLDDLAQHPDIPDAEAAKLYCKGVGVTSSGSTAEERLQQAKRVWLFVTLLGSPYGLDQDRALSVVDVAYPGEDLSF